MSQEPTPAVYESIGLLDPIQAFHEDTLAAGAVPLRLDPDARDILRDWVASDLTGEIAESLADLRRDLIRELHT